MELSEIELHHINAAVVSLQDPLHPCEVCDGIRAKILEELRVLDLNTTEGFEKLPVPEEYRKLGVVGWEREIR